MLFLLSIYGLLKHCNKGILPRFLLVPGSPQSTVFAGGLLRTLDAKEEAGYGIRSWIWTEQSLSAPCVSVLPKSQWAGCYVGELWKEPARPQLSLVRLKKRPWIRRWMLIYLQDWNSSSSKILGGKMHNHLLGGGGRYSELPWLGSEEESRRWEICLLEGRYLEWRALRKHLYQLNANISPPMCWLLSKMSGHACTVWWAGPEPPNGGKGEGRPVLPTTLSLQGGKGFNLSRGLCQSFVGVGRGITRTKESPAQSHSSQCQTLPWCWESLEKTMGDVTNSKYSSNPDDI